MDTYEAAEPMLAPTTDELAKIQEGVELMRAFLARIDATMKTKGYVPKYSSRCGASIAINWLYWPVRLDAKEFLELTNWQKKSLCVEVEDVATLPQAFQQLAIAVQGIDHARVWTPENVANTLGITPAPIKETADADYF